MTIKEFCTEYNKRVPQMQEAYIKDNLKITEYVPFVKKDALAENLVNISTYKYEDYTKEDGTIGRRNTNVIHMNSTVQYLLFCRIIIENYTNLTVETEGFFEEYDLLKQSGLLDKLMVSTETRASLIPMDEIAEFRAIVEMKSKDAWSNYATPQAYISNQVERFGMLLGITLNPIMEKIADSLENMDEKTIEKLGNTLEKTLKRIK
jgi:altronate dehydratase